MTQRTTSRRTPSRTALRNSYGHTTVLRCVLLLLVVSGVLAGGVLVGAAYRGASVARPQKVTAPRQDGQVGTLPPTTADATPYKINPKTTAYVVERDRMAGAAPVEQGQVLAVDTATLQITGRIDTHYDPQVALAPNGTFLYIAETDMSGNAEREQMRVVETATGRTTVTMEIPGRFRSTMFVTPGVLAVSQQGRYVYVEKGAAFDGGPSALAPIRIKISLQQEVRVTLER